MKLDQREAETASFAGTEGNVTTSAHLNRGSNQTGVRAYNERLVLALIRRHGTLSRADIARHTGLSAQTISVIIRSLQNDGLLHQGQRIRGKIGQPSMPMHLAADGAFAFGLKIGRRSAELILLDFLGNIRQRQQITYKWPVLPAIRSFALGAIARFTETLDLTLRGRIIGLGIAMPFELWNWIEETGAPAQDMQMWLDADLIADFHQHLPFPVFLQNDCTAACGAELNFGLGGDFIDFVYIFIGSFVGGGIVLNGTLFPGRTGNAGALGSMPVHLPAGFQSDTSGVPGQLIDTASLFVLERMLQEKGLATDRLWLDPENWSNDWDEAGLAHWIEMTARSLAQAIVASASVIDFSAAIIDGWMPDTIRARIVAATRIQMNNLDLQGLSPPQIMAGKTGIHAKAIGAARLPLAHQYLFDQNVLFKEAV